MGLPLLFLSLLLGLGACQTIFSPLSPLSTFTTGSSFENLPQSVSMFGSLVAVALPFEHESTGAVFIYDCTVLPCTHVQSILPTSGEVLFGSSISLSEGRLIASSKDAIHFYSCDELPCTEQYVLRGAEAGFGYAATSSGRFLLVTPPNLDFAYVFDCATFPCMEHSRLHFPGELTSNLRASSVDISGNLVAFANSLFKAIYLFDCTAQPCTLLEKLPTKAKSISFSGDLLAASHPYVGTKGRVTLYRCTAAGCTLLTSVEPLPEETLNRFGMQVSVAGSSVLVDVVNFQDSHITLYYNCSSIPCVRASSISVPKWGTPFSFWDEYISVTHSLIAVVRQPGLHIFKVPCQPGTCNTGACSGSDVADICNCTGTGMSGTFCDISPCSLVPEDYCNAGTCFSTTEGTAQCDCTGTFHTGERCEADPCLLVPTGFCNAGSCVATPNGASTCDCSGSFRTGLHCEIDPCATNPCVRGTCSASPNGEATCDCSGTGHFGPFCASALPQCLEGQDDHAHWPLTYVGEIATGVCQEGFKGAPRRRCGTNGIWEEGIEDPCEEIKCQAVTEGNAAWPLATIGSSVLGSCAPGFTGAPRRTCGPAGVWGSITSPCKENSCPASSSGNAQWPETLQGRNASGACTVGFVGTPTRSCEVNGTWGPISAPCVSGCASSTLANAVFPPTKAGSTATGSCLPGFTGSPKRLCTTSSVWQGLLTSPCICTGPSCVSQTVTFNALSGTDGTSGTISLVLVGSGGESTPLVIEGGIAAGVTVTRNFTSTAPIGRLLALTILNSNSKDPWKVDSGSITVTDASGSQTLNFGKVEGVVSEFTFEGTFIVRSKTRNTSGASTIAKVFATLTDVSGKKGKTKVIGAGFAQGSLVTQAIDYVNIGPLKSISLASNAQDSWYFEYVEVTRRGVTYRFNAPGSTVYLTSGQTMVLSDPVIVQS